MRARAMKTSVLRLVLRNVVLMCLALGVAMAFSPAATSLAGGKRTSRGVAAKPAHGHEKIEMFAGMKNGDIEVALIPKDPKVATIIIKNKTKKPVSVELPSAFAGVPVLAQFGGGAGGAGGGGGLGGGGGGLGGGGGGGGQGLGGGGGGGGGLGGGGGGFGGGGGGGLGGGGFFNIAPEKTRRLKVDTICLEHGKEDPHSRMKYRIIPITEFTNKPEVVEICRMLARGEVTQNIAQAASWHAANGLSWRELASKDRKRHITTGWTEKYFHPRELQFALRAVSVATQRAEHYKSLNKEKSPGELDSENQQFAPPQTGQQQTSRRRR